MEDRDTIDKIIEFECVSKHFNTIKCSIIKANKKVIRKKMITRERHWRGCIGKGRLKSKQLEARK